ncbi:DUF1800 family protein [Psychrobium sp. 1_MG-2023]|uniref:DUF1800 domain-containing protein n=1 Tax=Psychrobium sp. 1_MG-2023 TaxID=3062624 RepID=UPI000C3334A8|nr:DUF1800 family protein [Psychrobium sp. 1_MG-2023]MDP2559685.1 DUF1800 family protein [Psychrobium sp. 1_MG-2023]PKF59516.1 hypothetical protein CW748_01720 [Alteromonadales bacterium alter-6D02]
MKRCLMNTALALSVCGALNAPTYANDNINYFSFGLSTESINPNYDYLTDCKRDCDDQARIQDLEFWFNTRLGQEQAGYDLKLSQATAQSARFLIQSTYGPTAQGINQLADLIAVKGEQAAIEHWLTEQMQLPASQLTSLVSNATDHLQTSAWWHQSLVAPDQLRQRVAFALNHVLTISTVGSIRKDGSIAEYYDVLANNAFGNFRTLLNDVTYNIAMGVYLDNVRNNSRHQANENYARELMQLFTLGTERLNLDGSAQVDENGQPIETYTEADVVELAKALSGIVRGGQWYGQAKVRQRLHFGGEKVLFAGTDQVAYVDGSSAKGDIAQALDAIFNHPNVGPFIAKRLIQHLVTSNPSPQYIANVASVFNDNGQQVRGDMAAVIKAILLDPEARQPQQVADMSFYGKLKEPVLRFTGLLRAFDVNPARLTAFQISRIQRPLYADSVFSFFQPDDTHSGIIEDAGKVAPNFTLATEVNQATLYNALYKNVTESRYGKKAMRTGNYNRYNLDKEAALAINSPELLVDRYNLLLMGGTMSDSMKDKIVKHLAGVSTSDGGYQRARQALLAVVTSHQQAIQR